MWNCTKCNHEMEDDVLNCIECSSPKPDTFDENIDAEEDTAIRIYALNSNENIKFKKEKRDKKKELFRNHGVLVDSDFMSKEDYKGLAKKNKQLKKPSMKKNYKGISRVLKMLGYFNFILYFVAGIYLGIEMDMSTSFNWLIASTCFLVGFASGISFLGLSGVVKLMNDINSEKKAS